MKDIIKNLRKDVFKQVKEIALNVNTNPKQACTLFSTLEKNVIFLERANIDIKITVCKLWLVTFWIAKKLDKRNKRIQRIKEERQKEKAILKRYKSQYTYKVIFNNVLLIPYRFMNTIPVKNAIYRNKVKKQKVVTHFNGNYMIHTAI